MKGRKQKQLAYSIHHLGAFYGVCFLEKLTIDIPRVLLSIYHTFCDLPLRKLLYITTTDYAQYI